MASLNSLLIEGFVVGKIRGKDTKKGGKVCEFKIQDDKYINDEPDLTNRFSQFQVVCFDSIAIRCMEKLQIGSPMRIVGKLKEYRYRQRSEIKIIADHIEFKYYKKGVKENG